MAIARKTAEMAEPAPRERILAAAHALFYRRGIRAVSVDEIAEAATTNKMTLYRHFRSKDLLVTEYLRGRAADAERIWDDVARAHPGAPLRQLEAWVGKISARLAENGNRGCAIANAAIEIPEKDHPARPVIERHKSLQREQLARLNRLAGFTDPERLADEIFLLLEGARVNVQSVGRRGPGGRFKERALSLVKSAARRTS
jgi:AcrR family transcriptional regulator